MPSNTPLRRAILLVFILLAEPLNAHAFTFITAGETYGLDRVLHPTGYTGVGGTINISVGIDSSFAFSNEMEVGALNAMRAWMDLNPTNNNVLLGDANDIPAGHVDFESVAIHELGHALGLGHPNLGDAFLAGDNYTTSTDGPNDMFDSNPGADGIVGSADDIRGDDQNLNWFRKSNNNPFTIDTVVDSSTYSANLADLPNGDLYSTNPDRTVADQLFGLSHTESVMQQGGVADSARRTLGFDDVAGIRYGMSGLDEIQGTSDDYTINLVYSGFTDQADILLSMDLTGGAFTQTNFSATPDKHTNVLQSFVHFSFNENWFFSTCSSCSTATWDGTSGDWSDASKWNTNPSFPNNNGTHFDVQVDGGTVILDQAIAVQSVDLGNVPGTAATLQVSAATLTADQISVGSSSGSTDQLLNVASSGVLNVGNFLTIGDEGDGELDMSSGGQATIGSLYIARHEGSSGMALVSGSGTTLTSQTDTMIGFKGNGVLRIEDQALVHSHTKALVGGSETGSGTVVVTGAGSMWDLDGNITLGRDGDASLLVEDGGAVATEGQIDTGLAAGTNVTVVVRDLGSSLSSASWLIANNGSVSIENGASVTTGQFSEIAGLANQSADVVVTGAGSQWTVAEHLFIGSRGTGTLTISDGGRVDSGFGFNGLRLGWQSGSDGTLTVSGTSSELESDGPITVGDEGVGTLLVELGALVSTGDVVNLGANGSSTGTATIRDPGTQLTMDQFLIVNSGSMAIENGATVSAARFAEVASTSGRTASLTVSGAGTQMTLGEHFIIGSRGVGTTTIENGARVDSGFGFNGLRVGWQSTSNGTLTVTGAGSQANSTGPITVGDSGAGTLHIDSGGSASTQNSMNVAFGGGSTGQVVLTGNGSNLSVNNSLYVGGNSGGSGGTASITVQDGAALIVGSNLRLHNQGTFNLAGGSVSTSSLNVTTGTFNFTGGKLSVNSISGNLTNNGGTLAPGDSPGFLSFSGNYTQSSGALEIELGGYESGSQHDRVSISGSAILGGELQIDLLENFIPSPGSTFTVLTANNLTGQFTNVFNGQRLPTLGGEGSFLVNYDGVSDSIQLSNFLIDDPTRASAAVEALNTANILPSGPRTGATGKQFINIEGSDFGSFAGYGVVRIDATAIRNQLDTTFDGHEWKIDAIDLVLTQSNTFFTADGFVEVLFTDDDQVSIDPGSSPLAYPLGDGEFSDAQHLLDYIFFEVATGTKETYRLYDSSGSNNGGSLSLLADALSDDTITLLISDFGDPFVAATYAGVSNTANPGPTLAIVASLVSPSLPGDYNEDGIVDAADYTVWRDNFGAAAGTLPNDVDGGPIGASQYATWKTHFGEKLSGGGSGSVEPHAAVPEPASALLLLLAYTCCGRTHRSIRC